jgi:Tol biopolymer transport system component
MTPERGWNLSDARERLAVTRAVVVVIVVLVAVAAGAAFVVGSATASHRLAKAAVADAISPSWSPDGKQIAFVLRAVGSHTGYRIVRTSSKPGSAVHTVLSANGACCYDMKWGAGGQILVIPSSRLTSVDVHGGKPKRVDFSGTCRASPCSPQSFILSRNREYAGVTTMDGGSVHSPYGIQLVRMKPGRDPAVLPAPDGQVNDWILAFSPDGRQLVFSRSPWDPYGQGPPATPLLLAVRIGSRQPVPLAQSGIPGGSLVPSDVLEAQWSPDGRWVAFTEGQGLSAARSLEVVSTTSASAPSVVGTCPDWLSGFSWSPTSMLVAYYCTNLETDGSSQLMTVKPDGSQLTNPLGDHRLTAYSYYQGERQPQWSPDGSRLLILARRLGHQTIRVWTVRPNGHDLVRLG